ncbi:MAG TPA: hypothetical protein PKA20_17400 [Burkholderiaceae bacterium]|nr:hypothetical protein [Burkholderiaceae bacterium]
MSGLSPIVSPAGPVQALSVVNTAHAAVLLAVWPGHSPNFVLLQNSGTIPVAVRLSQTGVAPPAFPVDPTPADGVVVLLAGQTLSVPMPKGAGGETRITAIGSAAGPAILYATPVNYQA